MSADDRLTPAQLLQAIVDLAHYGPRYPDPTCDRQTPDHPGFDHANASYRLGIIVGLLRRHGVVPGPLAAAGRMAP